ncbi:MAG: asparagine synthetase B, partial [Candidatus Electrothrix sp. AR5]|nr:asparagine synthetase B [Candidatus Electrothrix sp. AR5]
MCGITGFFDFTHNSNLSILTAMTDTLIHRGPDGGGYELFKTAHAKIGLGHRRLSIIDLSAEGKQPMTSAGGRYVICFN